MEHENRAGEPLHLEYLKEYQTLTNVEKAIKERKEEIKQYFKNYFHTNNVNVTPVYENLFGVLEERNFYRLDPEVLEQNLPHDVFERIVDKSVNLEKAKGAFLDGQIPVQLLLQAERKDTTYSFAVRKFSTNAKSSKTIPFWRIQS